MKHVYHDVRSFVKAVRVYASYATAAEAAALPRNLPRCLLGAAREWFNKELDGGTREQLFSSLGIWCDLLTRKFQPSKTQAEATLQATRFTTLDVSDHRDPSAYIRKVARAHRNAHPAHDEFDIVWTAYSHLDSALRLSLPTPTPTPTLAEFSALIKVKKDEWAHAFPPRPDPGPASTEPGGQQPPHIRCSRRPRDRTDARLLDLSAPTQQPQARPRPTRQAPAIDWADYEIIDKDDSKPDGQ